MQYLQPYLFIFLLLILCSSLYNALDCQLNESKEYGVEYTITVDKSGQGKFTTIQSAIDSIPVNNNKWIRVQISPGQYKEKVTIDANKPCIFLEGAGSKLTSIEWGDHEKTSNSATFSSFPENIILKGITFKNIFNLEQSPERNTWKQAVAARLRGDKYIVHQCAFYGVQDTFWDEKGRHLINECYIEGALDFVFGKAKSIYQGCEISLNIGKLSPGLNGFMTAQKNEWPDYKLSGYVLKNCKFTGTGKAYFGRAWGPYATVIVYNSTISDVVVPEGWNAADYVGHEENFTYVEANNVGPGADTSKRVPWVKKLGASELQQFLDTSFIDSEDGWLAKLPKYNRTFCNFDTFLLSPFNFFT